MPRVRLISHSEARRGAILMVVLVLLTLFSILGLSFVLYAKAQAKSSDLHRQAEADPSGLNGPDADPDTLATTLLSTFVYGADDATGLHSAYRGHDFARLEYGYNYQVVGGKAVPLANNVPFNGMGRIHEPITFNGPKGPTSIDGYTLINYTCFQDSQGKLIDGFVRDPERMGVRTTTDISALGPFVGGSNVPWTYPDLNNMFLAAVKADGTVLTPSFHRYWTGFGPLDPANPSWYDATKPWLKYQVMRPRPVDHLLANEIWDSAANMPYNVANQTYRKNFFPPPADAGGDVKNLMGSPGTLLNPATRNYAANDSIWMDFGFPVLTTPDGKKYKPLAAVLMMDLDNRINVNVHGNIRGSDPATGNMMHVSNQGWGPWEVNLGAVLNADAALPPSAAQQPEWANLFIGQSGPTYGRYGPDGQPGKSGSYAQPPRPPRFFSAMDTDATRSPTYDPSDPFALPGSDGNAPAFFPFPYYPNASYGNGDAYELKNHPSLYGYFQQTGDDRLFPPSNMEALLRYGDVGTESLRSELLLLCPQNFTSAKNAVRNRNLVTTLSMDFDRPGCMPWARNDASASPYVLGAKPYPIGSAMPVPLPTGGVAPVATNGEFGGDGRSLAAALGRIDLNRKLTPYPATDYNGFFKSAPDAAIADRQQLARDIYDRLRIVTMGESPATPPQAAPPPGTVDPVFEARRWLAQLAVNIVDYIDEDDYMTPFNWYTDPVAGTKFWVFGTELPRVVLNEAYAEYANNQGDPDGDSAYDVNFWVELLNPFAVDNARNDTGTARLQAGSMPIYQMAILQNPDNSSTGFGAPGNSTGDVNKAIGANSTLVSTLQNWGSNASTHSIQPSNKQPAGVAGTNQNGFYVVGPKVDFVDGNGSFTATLQTDAMNYTIGIAPCDENDVPTMPAEPSTNKTFGIYLQRLACPGMPPQNNPNVPGYNPYITVDYLTLVSPNFAFQKIRNIPKPIGSIKHQAIAQRSSAGRTHPYAGYAGDQGGTAQLQAQKTAQTGQPLTTFFNKNDNAALAFDWLTHLDRQLVSPVELLHVSAYKPHELTQKFVSSAGTIQEHRLAPILFDRDLAGSNQSSRLYRAFDFFTVCNRSLGACTNGRVPGRVNLNTVWDVETFRALCDYQQANASGWDVDGMFAALSKSRTPGGVPGPMDVPFKCTGTPFVSPGDTQYPMGSGIDDTLFRRNATKTQALFEVAATHPVRKYELLNKIYNNVTTRSNVFAVWMTVGFFEVLDDSTRPVKLGAEIGLSQHTNVRHRIFAIIDRTNVRQQSQTPVFVRANSSLDAAASAPQTVTVDALSGTYEGTPWTIQAGTQLVVDVGPNQEAVTVTGVNGLNQFQAMFHNSHAEGFLINLNSLPGNPGPQQSFDLRQDSDVVRYYNIIN